MVERTPILDALTYTFLMIGICIVGFPIFYTVVAATLPLEEVSKVPMPLIPGDQFWVNIHAAWEKGDLGRQLMNSFIMASGITIGKICVSMLGAFSIVYFDYRLRKVAFATVFCTLMLPVEVRILPTYEIAANIFGPLQWLFDALHLNALIQWWVGNNFEISLEWSLLDSYTGLILPLVASATCTFLFRQFFLTVPEELCEAAKLDGASAMKFFFRILLPLSVTNIAALVVIEFVYGWNQYLWPLLTTSNDRYATIVMGIQGMIAASESFSLPQWNLIMATAILALAPPVLVVVLMQRWFIKGLTETEK
jgi:sn-glycerol 3-phosphate transport system permease protein